MNEFARGASDFMSGRSPSPTGGFHYALGYDAARRVGGDPVKRVGVDALSSIRTALHMGQKSHVKTQAQLSLEQIERVLREAQKLALATPEAGSLRAAMLEAGLLE